MAMLPRGFPGIKLGVCQNHAEAKVTGLIQVVYVGVAAQESRQMAKHSSVVRFACYVALCCGGLIGLTSVSGSAVYAADPPAAAKKAAHESGVVVEKPAAEAHKPANHDAGHDAGGDHGAAHGKKNPYDPLEWKVDLALWTLVTFGIFVVILRIFAWGPLASALDTREAKIHGNLAHAEEARVKAEQLLADYQAKLAAAQDEVLKTLAEARRDAEHTRQDILAQTEKDVAALKDRAVLEIERTRDFALNELFAHMAGTVANATEKVLGRALSDSDQDRLVNEALVEFSRQQAS
ncbi:MAG: synthase subunit b [Planctomycetaceae bacterium]|nr:synthase subunit b [Planctomycetaceae bacterium]